MHAVIAEPAHPPAAAIGLYVINGLFGDGFGAPADLAVLSAAVADWRVDTVAGGKIKKGPGGPPTLAVVPAIAGDLLCICGDQDPLMPPDELQAIKAALAPTGDGRRRELLLAPGAGHGFMCEARPDFQAAAAELGWQTMLQALAMGLSG
jgi:carboxymethylenebutenolidase